MDENLRICWGKLWGKFWGRILCKFLGRILCKFLGRIFIQVFRVNPAGKFRSLSPGLLALPWVRGHSLGSPPGWGGGLHQSSHRSFTPAVKTLELHVSKREDARTSMHFRLPAPHVCVFAPPVGVPSRDGSFGVSAWKGPASLGWSLLTLGARISLSGLVWPPPFVPPLSRP